MKRTLFACFTLMLFFAVADYAQESEVETKKVPQKVIESLKGEAPELLEKLVSNKHADEFWNSPLTLGAVVFVTTFIFEDAAVAASAYLISSHRMSGALGFFSLWAGIFLSDLFLYAIGWAIRRNRWLRGYLDVKGYESRAQDHIDKGFWMAITVARLFPGMLIPIFIFMGMTKANFKKVAMVDLVITGIYSLVALYLLIEVGIHISSFMGLRIWLVFGILFLLFVYRFQIWNWIRVLFVLRKTDYPKWHEHTHPGLPALHIPRRRTVFESLPDWITYAPIVAMIVYYTIRFRSLAALGVVNPGLENSGLWGESKSTILNSFPASVQSYIPKYLVIDVHANTSIISVVEAVKKGQLEFPLIAKPDVGYMSRGVEFIENVDQLEDYLEIFPEAQKLILQEYLSGSGEAGLFYAATPSATEPLITVALTYQPFVVGDGRTRLQMLLSHDPRYSFFEDRFYFDNSETIPDEGETVRLKVTGSTRDGAVHLMCDVPADSPLRQKIKFISASVPQFFLGRFDVKFESLDNLLRGEFMIIELNGVTGEDLTAWDPRAPIMHTYKTFRRQIRAAFEIGVANKARGAKAPSLLTLLKALIMQESTLIQLVKARRRSYKYRKTN